MPLNEQKKTCGVFLPHNKMGENPHGFFIHKFSYHILTQRSILHSVFKVVRVFYQNREISISPSGGWGGGGRGNPKIEVTKMAMYRCWTDG